MNYAFASFREKEKFHQKLCHDNDFFFFLGQQAETHVSIDWDTFLNRMEKLKRANIIKFTSYHTAQKYIFSNEQ